VLKKENSKNECTFNENKMYQGMRCYVGGAALVLFRAGLELVARYCYKDKTTIFFLTHSLDRLSFSFAICQMYKYHWSSCYHRTSIREGTFDFS